MNKTIIPFAIMPLVCCLSMPTIAQAENALTENEARFVSFAERVIVIELARVLSPSFRKEREACFYACPETGALELAIGLLGISNSDASTDALVNLLGLRLDAGGSEDRGCQILFKGGKLLRHLKQLEAKQIAEHCQTIFLDLRKRELANLPDVSIAQMCHSETEIQHMKNEWLKAIEAKRLCEE